MEIKDQPRRNRRTVVFVTFETPLAPAGGLAAVMAKLPAAMARAERCCVIAPFFRAITQRRRPHLLARIRPTGVQAHTHQANNFLAIDMKMVNYCALAFRGTLRYPLGTFSSGRNHV